MLQPQRFHGILHDCDALMKKNCAWRGDFFSLFFAYLRLWFTTFGVFVCVFLASARLCEKANQRCLFRDFKSFISNPLGNFAFISYDGKNDDTIGFFYENILLINVFWQWSIETRVLFPWMNEYFWESICILYEFSIFPIRWLLIRTHATWNWPTAQHIWIIQKHEREFPQYLMNSQQMIGFINIDNKIPTYESNT